MERYRWVFAAQECRDELALARAILTATAFGVVLIAIAAVVVAMTLGLGLLLDIVLGYGLNVASLMLALFAVHLWRARQIQPR